MERSTNEKKVIRSNKSDGRKRKMAGVTKQEKNKVTSEKQKESKKKHGSRRRC